MQGPGRDVRILSHMTPSYMGKRKAPGRGAAEIDAPV